VFVVGVKTTAVPAHMSRKDRQRGEVPKDTAWAIMRTGAVREPRTGTGSEPTTVQQFRFRAATASGRPPSAVITLPPSRSFPGVPPRYMSHSTRNA
jgi:hypothetical protein